MKQTGLERGILVIKQYMSETKKAYTSKEIAAFHGTSVSNALGVLQIMEAFGLVEKKKRGVTYYFLKDTYNDEQIQAMLPQDKPKPIRKKRIPYKPVASKSTFLEKYLAELNERANSGNGLAALAILGLPERSIIEPVYTETYTEKETEPKPDPMIKIESHGKILDISKKTRRLSPNESNYLKKMLKHIICYEVMTDLNTVFAKFSAIKTGRYGDTFYFSWGTNPWNNVLKVTLDPSLSNCLILPALEKDRWSNWNNSQDELRPKKAFRGQYDEMLDKFIESGHKLVEITLEEMNTNYVKTVLKKKIKERNLMSQIEVSRVENWIYLEKVD